MEGGGVKSEMDESGNVLMGGLIGGVGVDDCPNCRKRGRRLEQLLAEVESLRTGFVVEYHTSTSFTAEAEGKLKGSLRVTHRRTTQKWHFEKWKSQEMTRPLLLVMLP